METNNNNEITLGNGIKFVPNDESALRVTTYTFDYDGSSSLYPQPPVPKAGGYIYLDASKWHSFKVVDGGTPTTIPFAYNSASSTLTFGTVYGDGSIYIQPNPGPGQRTGMVIYVQTESGKSVAIIILQLGS
jgi:hypothetical protein